MTPDQNEWDVEFNALFTEYSHEPTLIRVRHFIRTLLTTREKEAYLQGLADEGMNCDQHVKSAVEALRAELAGEKEIRRIANRFLSWKLPKDFNPDCGIQFDADAAKKIDPRNHRYEPLGTHLLTATQAQEMVRFIIQPD